MTERDRKAHVLVGTKLEFSSQAGLASAVTIRGERLVGTGDRGEILLMHGGGQTRHAWGAGAHALAEAGWTCTSIDLRGHGDSDWSPDGSYDIASYVADVRGICAELGGDVVLVGASLGGITALMLSGESDAPVRALVLVDIVPRPEPEGVDRIRTFMQKHPGGFASLEEVGDAIAEYKGRERTRNIEGLKKNVRRREDGRWHWHWDPKILWHPTKEEPRPGVSGDELVACARRVKVPVLLLRGAASDVVGDAGADELAEAVADVEIAMVAGAGHMVAGDDNDAFISALLSFLDART